MSEHDTDSKRERGGEAARAPLLSPGDAAPDAGEPKPEGPGAARESEEAGTGSGAAGPQATARRRNRRRRAGKAREQSAEQEEPVELDADGRVRPAFLKGFPRHPDLDALVVAFERGDYGSVRRDAARVAARASDPKVRRAAQELVDRIRPDPLARLLLGAAVALWVFLLVWAYSHAH